MMRCGKSPGYRRGPHTASVQLEPDSREVVDRAVHGTPESHNRKVYSGAEKGCIGCSRKKKTRGRSVCAWVLRTVVPAGNGAATAPAVSYVPGIRGAGKSGSVCDGGTFWAAEWGTARVHSRSGRSRSEADKGPFAVRSRVMEHERHVRNPACARTASHLAGQTGSAQSGIPERLA